MDSTLYKIFQSWLAQTTLVRQYRKIKASQTLPNFSSIVGQGSGIQKSIVFLCPATDVPQGGVKVIYKQAAIIHQTKGLLAASVLHPYNLEFSCSWFDHGAIVKKDLSFDPTRDFIIIPECWAVPHARLLNTIGLPYGIYVQGGYVMGRWGSLYGAEHDAAYQNAALILAISDDTLECIKMAYPECTDRVHRVHYSVNPEKFNAHVNKDNIICYMPRRMKDHSQLVTFFLNKKIPPHWKIVSIDGLDETGVAAILGKAKIFLSFSELEGCPLPPVEAALSGCQVIGYTGEGAKEYWDAQIFTEIYAGDIKAFVNAVLDKIEEFDNGTAIIHMEATTKLANRYSAQVELADMQFISNKILEILSDVNTVADHHS